LIRPSVPPSGSHKCLRFGLWSTLCTIKHLFTYLLTIRTLHQLLGTVCHRRCNRCQILLRLRDILKHFSINRLT